MKIAAPLLAIAALLLPPSALAQPASPPEESVFDGDHLTIGAGVLYGPSYDGSDDYVVSPVPVVQGSLAGVEITPRPGGAAFDVIPDGEDPKLGFSFGPVATLSFNRARQIKDPVVRSAGKLEEAIEVGVNGGVTAYKLLHAYDSLTVSADVKWDINGAHSGRTIGPGISYFTPLSRAAIVTIQLGARHVDDDYAHYYYGVSPVQSAASGLPQFAAKGGWDSWNIGLLGGYDLSGNALDGGLALFVLGNYGRMLGDARRTPYTSVRGEPGQWTVGAGLGYTF